MSTISEVFTAAVGKEFQKPGKFFKLFRTSYPVDVRFYRQGQELPDDALQVEAGFGITVQGGFDRFTIVTAAAQTVSWFISNGNVNYDRTVGEVTVADVSKARTLAGSAFLLHQYCGGVAAQYSHAALWNPAGSGKNLILTRVKIFSSFAVVLYIGKKNAALATAGSTPFPKLVGNAAVSVGLGKKENNAAAQLSNEMSFLVAANAIPVSLPIGDDVIIPPGWCWGATNNTVNTDIGLQFDYFEEPTA